MKKNLFYGIIALAISVSVVANVKSNTNLEGLSDISMANIEALAGMEGDAVSCTETLNCYSYGQLIKTVSCSSTIGDCSSGVEGLFRTPYIKCEGKKYTC